MPKKRGNNEGTLQRRPNGSWRAAVSVAGRRVWRTFKTKRQAQEWLRKTLDEVDQGFTLDSASTTLAEFMAKWLVSTQSSLRPNTHKQYTQIVSQHIEPVLGKLKVRSLKPDHIQQLYDNMVAAGKGLRSVQLTHAVLHRCLVHAARLGIIPRNPAAATTPPKPKRKEMMFFDEDQVQTMLLTARGDGQIYALLHLAISTGMRQGELLGLKWSDLDWQTSQLNIRRQLSKSAGAGYELTTPKTKAGIRNIDLGENTILVLREHQQEQYQQISQAADQWHDHDLIFPSSIGTHSDRDNLRRQFKIILEDAGLPEIRFHDLRHTAAALMLSHGVPVIVVSRRLGHARPSITLDIYGHLIPQQQREATALMDRLLTPIQIDLDQD